MRASERSIRRCTRLRSTGATSGASAPGGHRRSPTPATASTSSSFSASASGRWRPAVANWLGGYSGSSAWGRRGTLSRPTRLDGPDRLSTTAASTSSTSTARARLRLRCPRLPRITSTSTGPMGRVAPPASWISARRSRTSSVAEGPWDECERMRTCHTRPRAWTTAAGASKVVVDRRALRFFAFDPSGIDSLALAVSREVRHKRRGTRCKFLEPNGYSRARSCERPIIGG